MCPLKSRNFSIRYRLFKGLARKVIINYFGDLFWRELIGVPLKFIYGRLSLCVKESGCVSGSPRFGFVAPLVVGAASPVVAVLVSSSLPGCAWRGAVGFLVCALWGLLCPSLLWLLGPRPCLLWVLCLLCLLPSERSLYVIPIPLGTVIAVSIPYTCCGICSLAPVASAVCVLLVCSVFVLCFHHQPRGVLMYYIYSNKSGKLLCKTQSVEILKCYLPTEVTVHWSH